MTSSKTLTTATGFGKMPDAEAVGDQNLVAEWIECMVHRVGRDRYALYFAECTFQFDAGILTVQAENEFAMSQIRNRFNETLRQAAAEFFGTACEVNYVIGVAPRVQTELFSRDTYSADSEGTDAAESGRGALGKRKNRRSGSSGLEGNSESERRAAGGSLESAQGSGPAYQQLEIFSADQLPPRVTVGKSRSIRTPAATPNTAPTAANEKGTGSVSSVSPASRAGMSLGTFQFGGNNLLAKAAIDQIMIRPGQISPLVLFGPVGSGKTHLATGLGQQLRRKQGAFNVLQLSAEQFTTRFLQALNGKGLPSLRQQFRDVDLLILEDIQFFNGKKATLIELQHTIDSLLRLGKQLILTVDRHPNDLTFLSPEIQTRLVSGLVIPLQPADRDARVAICENWCSQWRLQLAPGMIEWLADHIVGDTRRLSGALFRLMATQSSRGALLEPSTAMEFLSDYVGGATQLCSLSMIQKAVCGLCGVEPTDLAGEKRTRKISGARMLAMFLARKHTPAALSEIGEFFGGRRHSTVVAAEKRIRTWVQSDEQLETANRPLHLREAIRKIESQLKVG